MSQTNLPDYHPTSYLDFSKPEHKKAMEEAIAKVRKSLGDMNPNWISGKEIITSETFTSLNPSNTSEVIGKFPLATKEHALEAVESAYKAFHEWSRKSWEERAGYLLKASELMKQRRHEFSAMMILEVGKNYPEADADTAEAIDFMEFYAREALRYGAVQNVYQLPGETDEMIYIPLGVTVVVPPWNFPLAILVGMTVAALVTGNTVVLKPSSYSPSVGRCF